MPSTSYADAATNAARNLTKALMYPHPITPFSPIKGDRFRALKKLADVFTASTNKYQKIKKALDQHPDSNVTPRVPIPTNQSNCRSSMRVHITKKSKLTPSPMVHIITSFKNTLPPPRLDTMHVARTQGPALI